MTTIHSQPGFAPAAFVVAVLAACGAARAEGIVAQSSVTAGVGVVSGDRDDRALFGQYNGMRPDRTYGLLDFDYYRRNDTTGTLATFQGIGVLGENRELHFLWKRQGNWKIRIDFSELVRRDPNTINTALVGAGTTTPQVVYLSGGPGSGSDLHLRTKRQGLGLSFSKWLSPSLELQASFKSENKDGSRLFGKGFSCPSPVAPGCAPTTGANPGWAVLMLPEPIDSNHSQFETRLSYASGKLRLTGGYYGSFYNNSLHTLTPDVPGSLNSMLGTLQPLNAGLQPILAQSLALPPDNQAHHLDVSGVYVFTPTTRGTFKLGKARATQDQGFAGSGFAAPTGVRSLDGRVDTTLAQLGLSSRPIPKLSLLADLRRDDRNDRTPLAYYNVIGQEGTSTFITYTNRQRDHTKTRGKLQANYRFSPEYRGTFGFDYEAIDRGTFTPSSSVYGISALRQKTEERSWRVELHRRMTETFSGAIRLSTSKRDGSGWLRPASGKSGVVPFGDPGEAVTSTSIFMPTLADRDRDKVRLFALWQPIDPLTLHFSADFGRDRFTAPSTQGLQRTDMRLFNLEADYALSSRWSLNGYLSRGSQTLDQARPGGYIMAFDNDNTAIGLGIVGKPAGPWQLGATLSYFEDENTYRQNLDPAASAGSIALLQATGGLPDIVFRTTELRLFGQYALSKVSSVRFDLIHHRAKFNDWTYGFDGTPFLFSDNSTVSQLRSQNVTFVGLRYTYQWR